jgi:hypothetical protein
MPETGTPLPDMEPAPQETRTATGEAVSQASDLAESAKESAAAVASRAGAEVRTLTDEAAGKARDVLGDARTQLKAQAADQAGRVAEALHNLAGQLGTMAGAAQPGIAQDLASQIAEQTDRFAGRLDQGGLDGALADLRRFARNQPGLFLLGAAAAGAVTGRVLKSVDTHALVEAAKPAADEAALGAGRTETVDLTAPATPEPMPLEPSVGGPAR